LREENSSIDDVIANHSKKPASIRSNPPLASDAYDCIREEFGNQRASHLMERAGFRGVKQQSFFVAFNSDDVVIRNKEEIRQRPDALGVVFENGFIPPKVKDIKDKINSRSNGISFLSQLKNWDKADVTETPNDLKKRFDQTSGQRASVRHGDISVSSDVADDI